MAGKSISDMTYLVLSWKLNLNQSISFLLLMFLSYLLLLYLFL